MEKSKRKTLAGRLSGRVLIWLFFIAIVLSLFIFNFTARTTRGIYSQNYHDKMRITYEYTRRVISDVYVAVTNNIYYVEHTLDQPDKHKETMERIVESGTRVRSCGISFIENYYPEKGHRFNPYAWRNAAKPDVTWAENMGDADLNYLNEDWFRNVIETDSACWSDPFYDTYDAKTTLSAYQAPIHDASGRPIGVLRADISLDWLASKLNETDSTVNHNASFLTDAFHLKSTGYIINHDGTFITHPDEGHIMKDNLFSKLKSCDGSDVEELIEHMQSGQMCNDENHKKFLFDDEECYIFYMPVKYTQWLIVVIVPSSPIDMQARMNGLVLTLFVVVAMLLIVLISYFYIKNAMEPVTKLTKTVNDMSNDQFDTPMPDMKYDDEISRLRDSIEKMQFSISNFLDAQKRKKQ